MGLVKKITMALLGATTLGLAIAGNYAFARNIDWAGSQDGNIDWATQDARNIDWALPEPSSSTDV